MAVAAQCSARMLVTEVIKILPGFLQKFAHLRANILFFGWGTLFGEETIGTFRPQNRNLRPRL